MRNTAQKNKTADTMNLRMDAAPSAHVVVSTDNLFGIDVSSVRDMSIPYYEGDDKEMVKPLVASADMDFVFIKSELDAVLRFLSKPYSDALYLYGPSGSGKTSIVVETAARLGWPMIQLTMNGRSEISDLIGHPTVVGDSVEFVHGPLARAMKYGYILLINEIDLADPSELAGLNDVLEGRPLTVVQNFGEVIMPHPDFRLVATANTRGAGEGKCFQGTQALNSAFLDRFRFISCRYANITEETAVLTKRLPLLTSMSIEVMLRVAGEVREAHNSFTGRHVYMSMPMTTRTLIRWGHIASMINLVDDPLDAALDEAFAARLGEDERAYVHRLLADSRPQSMEVFSSTADLSMA